MRTLFPSGSRFFRRFAIRVTVLLLGGLPLCSSFAPAQPAAQSAQLDALLQARHGNGAFHGAAAIGTSGDRLYAAGFGMADRDRGLPNTPDTRFLIGSLTKQFTAALILTLVRDGSVTLDAPVARYLPNYAGPGAKRITVHHLLTHRSGLPSFADARAAVQGAADALDALDFAPGTKHAYSNAGYVLLGLLAEAVTGQPYDEALRERVLAPAGVAGEIGYAHSGHNTEGVATGYTSSWWSWGYHPVDDIDPDGPFSAGMLYATPTALLQWTRALHTGQVLPDALVQRMTTPYSENGYGYGLIVEETEIHGHSASVIHHGGGIPGFTAALRYVQLDRGRSYTIAVLDNTQSDATVQTAIKLQEIVVRAQPVEE